MLALSFLKALLTKLPVPAIVVEPIIPLKYISKPLSLAISSKASIEASSTVLPSPKLWFIVSKPSWPTSVAPSPFPTHNNFVNLAAVPGLEAIYLVTPLSPRRSSPKAKLPSAIGNATSVSLLETNLSIASGLSPYFCFAFAML